MSHECGRGRSAAELLGVMELPTRGRDRIVVTAIELFYRYGINAVGLDRVLAEAGVTKTTFYKHFESKDELVVAALKMRDAWESAAWERCVRRIAGDDPRAQLRGYFLVFDQWFNDPDFGGCMFINAAAEFPNPNDPIHRAAAAHKRATRDAFRELAVAAGATEPDAFADIFAVMIEGVLVLRQVHDRNDAAAAALPAVDALLDRYLPSP